MTYALDLPKLSCLKLVRFKEWNFRLEVRPLIHQVISNLEENKEWLFS
jgi:hypothetical protein